MSIESTYVFPENMLRDTELLVKRVGHWKSLISPNYWTKKKLSLQWSRQKPAITALYQHRISSVLKSASLVCVLYWYLWVLICISLIIREVEDLFICIVTVSVSFFLLSTCIEFKIFPVSQWFLLLGLTEIVQRVVKLYPGNKSTWADN